MSFVGLAIGGAVLAAGATAYAGSESAGAIKSSTNAAIGEQNQIAGQQAALEAPYVNVGQSAIAQYEGLLGIGPSGNSASVQNTLANTPGYQFTKNQGIQATTNQASAMGLGLSGNTLEGLDTFTTGLADQTYQQAVGNAQGAVGIGQAAASGEAANLGATGSNVSNLLSNQGNTLAGIDANTVAGISKAVQGGAQNAVLANTLSNLTTSNTLQPYTPTAQAWPTS